MSGKYSRHQSVISRNADDGLEEDHWLKQFEKKLEKGAVQTRQTESIYDQISSIMNGKSKYPSVAAAVEDMKERSGLSAYLKKSKELDAPNTKTASDDNSIIDKKIPIKPNAIIVPIVIKSHPPIADTIKNIITDGNGNLSLPAIIDRVRSIHQADISNAEDWEDPNLLKYVCNANLKEKQSHQSGNMRENDLGKRDNSPSDDIDPSNTDAFFALNPAK